MLPLYKNIKLFRIQKGLSQECLAKMIGYTDRSSIAKIESGKVDLPQSKIKMIADALGVEPGELMGNEKPTDHKASRLEELGYYNLSPESRALVDALIQQLSEKQSND